MAATEVFYKGDWYELPEKLTLGEMAFAEGKFDRDSDEWRSAQMTLAMTYFAVRRVLPKVTWQQIADIDDFAIRGGDEPEPEEDADPKGAADESNPDEAAQDS